MCRILSREPYRCEVCGARFFLPNAGKEKVVRVAIGASRGGKSRGGQVRLGETSPWARSHLGLIACLVLAVVVGAVAAVEIYEMRRRTPTAIVGPQRRHRYVVIRRITPVDEATPAAKENKSRGPVRKPEETSRE